MTCCAPSCLEVWLFALSLISTIAWGIYVIYTIRTFNQIKKQTDLQSRGFLFPLVKENVLSDVDDKSISSEAMIIHRKWKGILESNLPSTFSEEKILQLNLCNKGKSSIHFYSITVTVDVDPGEYLARNITASGERKSFTTNSDSQTMIEPGGSILVNIIPFGAYPQAVIEWQIQYKDILGNQDSTRGYRILTNQLAFNYAQQNS